MNLKQLKAVPLPRCCQNAVDYPAVTLALDSYNDTDNATAKWHIMLSSSFTTEYTTSRGLKWLDNKPEPKFCPYCGTELPTLRRKAKLPKKICRITDGGYYCDTCEKRLMSCKCLPPEAAFEEDDE